MERARRGESSRPSTAQLDNLAQAGRSGRGGAAAGAVLLLAFYEVIGQGGPHASATSSAVGGFKSALKAKGIIASTRVAQPLASFGPAEERRVAEALRRHGFL